MNEKWSAYCCLLWCSICKVVFAIEIFLFAWANSKCSDIKWLWAMWIECLFRVCMNWRIIYLFIMSNYRNHNDTTINTKRKKKSAEQRNSKNRLRTLFVWANKTYSNLPKTEHKINKSNKKPILPHFTFTYKLQQLLVTTAGWCVWFLSFMLHFFVFFSLLLWFDLVFFHWHTKLLVGVFGKKINFCSPVQAKTWIKWRRFSSFLFVELFLIVECRLLYKA